MNRPGSRWDVVVTGASNRVGYNVVRSLARHGLRVGVGVDASSGMARYSRYCAGSFELPSHHAEPAAYIQVLKETLLAHDSPVCIPTDEDVFVVAEHLDVLQQAGARTAVAPIEILRRLDNKHQSTMLAQSLGIPTPATILPGDGAEIEAFGRSHPGPLVMKFVRSSAARGVHYLFADRLKEQLAAILAPDGSDYGSFIVQEFIRAPGYGVSMLFEHGRLKAGFAHRRLRELLPSGGPSTLRQSIRHPELEAYAERMLATAGYHGVGMVEFKHDAATGRSWFIEVNPRWWGSAALAIHAGVDFPVLFYQLATGQELGPADYRSDVTVRWLLGDLLALKNQLLADKRLPHYRELFPIVNGYDDAYADDPSSLAAELMLYGQKILFSRSRARRRPLV